MSSFKLKPIAIALLTMILIVSCQNNTVRQVTNSQIANCRTVQHAFGEVCVPQTPRRLVSLDEATLADALALGVPSVGVATDFGEVPSYLKQQNNNLMLLGKSAQPNLERMLKLDPDSIVGIDILGESILPQLSQIAPTALGKWEGFSSWREHFDFVARVLGKETKAKEVWDLYYQRIAEIKVLLGEQLEHNKMAFIYIHSGAINIDLKNSFVGSIFADLGIRQPENYAAVDWGVVPLSEETIPEIDANIIFVSAYGGESEQEALVELQQKPLWQQLNAVQAGEVYVVDADIWKQGNPIAANLVLDDLYKYLVNTP